MEDNFYKEYWGSQSSMIEEFLSLNDVKSKNAQSLWKKQSISEYEAGNLEDELKYLKKVKRKEVANRIKEARLRGNLSNSKEFDDAREEQRQIEKRIERIELILANAMIDLDTVNDLSQVKLGSKVRIYDIEYEEEFDYYIVSSAEASSLQNRISDQSPLGKELIGKKVGEKFSVHTSAGTVQYLVKAILGIDKRYSSIAANSKKVESVPKRIVDINPKDFVTRVNLCKCQNNNHKVIDIGCRIKVLNTSGNADFAVIPGAFCETCKRYFVLETEYQKLKNKNLILVCKVVEKEFWASSGSGYATMNKESLLHILGYNVNAQNDIPKLQRWHLLELIVNEGILSATEICSHLQMLIRRTQNNRNFDNARKKWKEDYEHISSYQSTKRSTVSAKSITHNQYKKK